MSVVQQNFDPRVLLKIMGSRAAIEAKSVDPFTLGLSDSPKNTRTLRTAIDAYLPSFYLVDLETIVNETFNQLDIVDKRFFTNVYNKKIVIQEKDVEEKSSGWDIPKKEEWPNKISEEKYDNYVAWITACWNSRSTLMSGMRGQLKSIPDTLSFDKLMTVLTNYRDSLANRFAKPGTTVITDSQIREKTETLIKTTIAGKFGRINTKEAEKLIQGFNSEIHFLFYGPSFDNVKSLVHNKIQEVFYNFFNSSVDVELVKEQFKIGNFVAAGHSGYRQKGGTLYGITPQIITASLVLEIFGTKGQQNLAAQEDFDGLVKNFFLRTLHSQYVVDFNLNTNYDTGVLFDLGISMTRSMNFSFNSFELSPDENRILNNLIKDYKLSLGKLVDEINKGIKSGNKIFDYVFRTVRRSPPLMKVLKSKVFSPLTNEVSSFPAKSTKDTIKADELIKLPKFKKKVAARTTTSKRPVAPKSTKHIQSIKPTTKSLVDLNMLMMLINTNLHDQIKRNMGTGNSRNVLNYRTGRFAESVKVERMSESRQGMITAFYSYMKNPYATFSRGGRQERPFTRDPKLLISKSIRELAGAQVANRMRAVNV